MKRWLLSNLWQLEHMLSVGQILSDNETVVVVGCGPIGLGIIKFAQLAGAQVIAIDVNEQRLAFAKSLAGADHTLNALKNPIAAIAKLTNHNMAHDSF